MRAGKLKRTLVFRWAGSLALAFALSNIVLAERLPIRVYTTADGLPRDQINRIVRDSHGFLWFCTAEGLSRFDGYRFTTYTTAHGLPSRDVLDLLETRDGVYWVATGDGLCRFNPQGISQSSGIEKSVSSESTGVNPLFVVQRDAPTV